MTLEEIDKTEQALKEALAFYEGYPVRERDAIAALCIRYALTMKPWLGNTWGLSSRRDDILHSEGK